MGELKMDTRKLITAALLAHAPKIAEDLRAHVRTIHARIAADLGPGFKGVTNSCTWARTFRTVVQPYTGLAYAIDEERLIKKTAKQAEEMALAWAEKIIGKMGTMDTVTAPYLSGNSFTVTGTRGGKNVRIEQNMIINVSPRGTVFNQFPSRIYVGGKLMSAKAYETMFAAKKEKASD